MSLNVDRSDTSRPSAAERPKRRRERDAAEVTRPASADAAATPIDSFLAVLVGAMRPATPSGEKASGKAGVKGPVRSPSDQDAAALGVSVPGSANDVARGRATTSTAATPKEAGATATAARDDDGGTPARVVGVSYGALVHSDKEKEQAGGSAAGTPTSEPITPPSSVSSAQVISVTSGVAGSGGPTSPSGPPGRGTASDAVDSSKRVEPTVSLAQPDAWAAIASGSIGARNSVTAGEAGSDVLATVPGQVVHQLAPHLPAGGDKTLVMRLNPPTLGEVLLRITSREGQAIRLRFDVQHGETREALARGVSHIEDLLRSHGLAPDGFSIDVRASSTDRMFAGDGQHAPGNPTAGPGGEGSSAGYARNPGTRWGRNSQLDRPEEDAEGDTDSSARIRLVSGGRLVDYHL